MWCDFPADAPLEEFHAEHPVVVVRSAHGLSDTCIVVPITSCLCSNNGDVLRAAALKGNGITRLPTFIIGADIKAQRLREVLPSYAPTSLGIYALYVVAHVVFT